MASLRRRRHRGQLEAFTYRGEQFKIIDQSRGVRNPAS